MKRETGTLADCDTSAPQRINIISNCRLEAQARVSDGRIPGYKDRIRPVWATNPMLIFVDLYCRPVTGHGSSCTDFLYKPNLYFAYSVGLPHFYNGFQLWNNNVLCPPWRRSSPSQPGRVRGTGSSAGRSGTSGCRA